MIKTFKVDRYVVNLHGTFKLNTYMSWKKLNA